MNKYRDYICAVVELIVIIILLISFMPHKEPEKTIIVKKVEIECLQPVSEEIEEPTQEPVIENQTKEVTTKKVETTKDKSDKVLDDFIMDSITASITHYGPDCKGCSGITASGYNVKNTIYYDDSQYGSVRVVAMDKNIPLYSIIRINDYKDGNFLGIVLDRGGAIKGNKIDILVGSEKEASRLGIQRKASVDILRRGKYAN